MASIEFDQIRLDALREISSIASDSAASSLSVMLGKRVDITVPNIVVEALEKVPKLLGGREKTVTAVYFSVSGQVPGSMLLVLSSSESLGLVHDLCGKKVTKVENLGEMEISALKELANIITGSYIRLLSQELKVKIAYSIPGFAHDMVGAILDEILAPLALEAEYAIIIESEFIVKKKGHRGHLVFIMAPDALGVMIEILGNWQKYARG